MNPADFMIGLVNDDFIDSSGRGERQQEGEEGEKQQGTGTAVVIRKGDAKGFADAWEKHVATPIAAGTAIRPSSVSSSASSQHQQLVPNKDAESPSAPAHSGPAPSSSLIVQYSRTLTLTRRNFLNYSRNLLAFGVRIGMYLGMGILLATVWLHLSPTSTRINDGLSVQFFSLAFLGFMSVAGIPAFLEERSVLLRESKNRLYGPLAFTLANTISTIPLLFLCSLLFSVLEYWSIGLHSGAGYFFRFLAFLYLGVLAAEFQALLIAAAIPIFVTALAVCAFLNGFWMCVQGCFIRAVSLPRFWYYWAHWIDYETFAFDVLVKNDFTGLIFKCQGIIAEGNCKCSFPSSLVK